MIHDIKVKSHIHHNQSSQTVNISDEIVKEWGLAKLSKEEKEDMVERIGRLIYQAILVRSLDLLSEEEQEELDLFMDEEGVTAVEVMQFLADKIPTLESIRKEEVENLKRDILVSN